MFDHEFELHMALKKKVQDVKKKTQEKKSASTLAKECVITRLFSIESVLSVAQLSLNEYTIIVQWSARVFSPSGGKTNDLHTTLLRITLSQLQYGSFLRNLSIIWYACAGFHCGTM